MSKRINLTSVLLSLYFVCFITVADIEITHINIGQGDSTLLQGPEKDGHRFSVLIDAGNIKNPDAGIVIANLLAEKNIKKLDAVIVTHYDADHIGGLITQPDDSPRNHWGSRLQDGVDGIRNTGDDVEIIKLIDRGFSKTSSIKSTTFKQYKQLATKHENHYSLETKSDIDGFILKLGDGSTLTALSANGYVRNNGNRVSNITTENERSLSFLLSYGDFNYFIGGDVTGRKSGGEDAKIEIAIAKHLQQEQIFLDVIQVNHHGANNGSSIDFLKLTKPKVAIISAGNGNSHKHPTYGALKRLSKSSIESIFVTEFGSTVWNDSVLNKKSKELSSMEKAQVSEIELIRDKLIVTQNNVTITSDGISFKVLSDPINFSAQ
jgi:competence protein ComEC